MHHKAITVAGSALFMVLAGCAQDVTPPVERLKPPAARLMVAPTELPPVIEGADLYDAAAVCRAEFGRETSKLVSLQSYVRIVTKKK